MANPQIISQNTGKIIFQEKKKAEEIHDQLKVIQKSILHVKENDPR